jgi:hypothetical protein
MLGDFSKKITGSISTAKGHICTTNTNYNNRAKYNYVLVSDLCFMNYDTDNKAKPNFVHWQIQGVQSRGKDATQVLLRMKVSFF